MVQVELNRSLLAAERGQARTIALSVKDNIIFLPLSLSFCSPRVKFRFPRQRESLAKTDRGGRKGVTCQIAAHAQHDAKEERTEVTADVPQLAQSPIVCLQFCRLPILIRSSSSVCLAVVRHCRTCKAYAEEALYRSSLFYYNNGRRTSMKRADSCTSDRVIIAWINSAEEQGNGPSNRAEGVRIDSAANVPQKPQVSIDRVGLDWCVWVNRVQCLLLNDGESCRTEELTGAELHSGGNQ